jgi:hypothetical protein
MLKWAGLLAGLSCTSCFVSASAIAVPSSRFVYPNSNVTAMTESKGSHTKLCGLFFIPFGTPDADDVDTANREAVEKVQGANLMIDVRADTSLTMILYGFLNICSVKVQGTAAKMEVGRQALDAAPAAQACKRDKDCPGDQECRQNRCAPPNAAPQRQACKRDKDCKGDDICNNGFCEAPASSPAPGGNSQ